MILPPILLFVLVLPPLAQQSPLDEFLNTEFDLIERFDSLGLGINIDQPMAQPGGVYNETDACIFGYPSQRLIFAGRARNLSFVYYEQGGFEYSTNLVLYRQHADVCETLWVGKLLFKKKADLGNLKKALSSKSLNDYQEQPVSKYAVYVLK